MLLYLNMLCTSILTIIYILFNKDVYSSSYPTYLYFICICNFMYTLPSMMYGI